VLIDREKEIKLARAENYPPKTQANGEKKVTQLIAQRGGRTREIEQWNHIKSNTELAQEFVHFFQLAFEWLPNKTLREAWFGNRMHLLPRRYGLRLLHT